MSSHHTSRSRRRTSRPSRRTTTTVRTLGAPSTAASAVGERRGPTFLAPEGAGRPRGVGRQGGGDEVLAPADPPGGPWDAAGWVEDTFIGGAPDDAKITLPRPPEPVEVLDGPTVQRCEVSVAVGFGKLTQSAAREIEIRGGPGEGHSNEPTPGVVL